MLTLQDPRLIITFGAAVVLTGLGLAIFARHLRLPVRRIHRGTVIGGVIFGVGWAVTGICPAVPFVQLGEGRLFALISLVGMLFGSWLYPVVHARYFRWAKDSCGGD
ncbi:MAG: YeeE/YedE family protein [Elusimicrobia bacterium]|nr:YeeE/YedE family protein [Elusimicrobiota bacterium]